MAFKIKTTNPKQYFVRPNQGVVPGRSDMTASRVVIHGKFNHLHFRNIVQYRCFISMIQIHEDIRVMLLLQS